MAKIFDNSTTQKKPEEKSKNKQPTKKLKPSATQNAPATHPSTEAEDQIRHLHDQISLCCAHACSIRIGAPARDNSQLPWELLVKQIGLSNSQHDKVLG